ncbi:MAG TPA: PhzF family phenazine biosynthesis protein [Soehngenia sp.]|nr:PhzF family phenazine biosynthesis protein [Soehngenia sp.]HPP31620.1 PhzF family phenazine biosynthesis protein [Soehngenia sp.]
MELNIFQIDAFTDKAFGGNPAGVVISNNKLPDRIMQQIAKEMNLSETVFVTEVEKERYQVRYFTPECEVDLCGHATIGGVFLLADEGYIANINKGKKSIHLNTKIGDILVDITYDNFHPISVVMEQKRPESYGVLNDMHKLAEILNIKEDDIGIDGEIAMPEIMSTGLKDIICPIKSKSVLDNMNVDLKKLKDYSLELGVVGLHAFNLDDKDSSKAYARNFGPAVGIDEEAATGTSNGALIYYLKKNGFLKGDTLKVSQGYILDRPSTIECFIEESKDGFRVKVGGSAVKVIEGIIKF